MRQHNILYIFIVHTYTLTCVSIILCYTSIYIARVVERFVYILLFLRSVRFLLLRRRRTHMCKIRGRALNNIRVYSRQDAFVERYKARVGCVFYCDVRSTCDVFVIYRE